MADRQPLVAVLAAGLATRFGGGKLDADLVGKPVGRWVLDAVEAAGLTHRFVVTGPEMPSFARNSLGWQVIVNQHPGQGLSGSVAAAHREALDRRLDLLLLLADMPLIAPDHLLRLTQAPGSSATRYPDGRVGVPALIRVRDQEGLASLSGDRGAGQVLAKIPGIIPIETSADGLLDIDDEEGLVSLRKHLG